MTDNATTTTDANNTEAGATSQETVNAEVKTEAQTDSSTKQAEGESDTAKESDKQDADKTDEKKDTKEKSTVPEKYADFALVEGVSVNPETMEKFTALAKKHGLSQEAAQEFATLGSEVANGVAMKPATLLQELTDKWGKEVVNDKELGGDKLGENLSVAKKALDAFGTDKLKSLLGKFDAKDNPNGTGLGNHPEIIRFFYSLGKAISEDNKVVTRDTSGTAAKDPAEVLYGKKN